MQLPAPLRHRILRGVANLLQAERLGNHLVDELLEIVRALPLGRIAGHHQDRSLRMFLGDLERQSDADHPRHHDVRDQEILVRIRSEPVERIETVVGGDHVMPAMHQGASNEFANRAAIFCNQKSCHCSVFQPRSAQVPPCRPRPSPAPRISVGFSAVAEGMTVFC